MLHLPRGRTGRITVVAIAVAALTGGIAVAASPSSSSDGPEAPPPTRNLRVNAAGAIPQSGYVSLAPCRIADTRKAVGAIGQKKARAFYVGGTAGFAPQGGTSGGCKVPVGASAVALAVTTTQAAGTGYLTFYADGSARPATNQTSYGTANVTTLVNAPVNATTGKVAVFAAQKTHVLLDVAGYYREPIAARVNSLGTLGVHSNQITAATKTTTGEYSVTFNQPIDNCIVGVTALTSTYNAAANAVSNPTTLQVYTRNVTMANSPYADSGFDVTITC